MDLHHFCYLIRKMKGYILYTEVPVCVCVCVCVCVSKESSVGKPNWHIYTCTRARVCTCVRVHMYMHMRACVHTGTHVRAKCLRCCTTRRARTYRWPVSHMLRLIFMAARSLICQVAAAAHSTLLGTPRILRCM